MNIVVGFAAAMFILCFWAGAFPSRKTPIIDLLTVVVSAALFGVVVSYFYEAVSA